MRIGIGVNGKTKNYYSSRFIYECFNGPIPPGLVVNHINRDRLDNRLENLRLVTPRENSLNRTPKIRLIYRRPVIGVSDGKTLEESELKFPSINSAGKYYDINTDAVKYVADGITNSAYSKRLKCRLFFCISVEVQIF